MNSETKKIILIVDDTSQVINLLRDILRPSYKVFFATDGAKALQAAISKIPDLILLDVMMPEMDGYEVCEKLKANEKTWNIPVIFVTARDDGQDEARGFASGAVDYITKPFSRAVVLARVKSHLELQQAKMILGRQNEEIRHQNDELQKTAQLRDDVDQIVRHDLKSPLNAIISSSDCLLNDDLKLEPVQEQFLRIIEESGYRMLDMINRSHDLYKMETGIYALNASPVDVLVICNKLIAELTRRMKTKKIDIIVLLNSQPACSNDVFVIAGEELLFYSMLSNLIKNAVEASHANEHITILLDRTDVATIKITNKGSVPVAIRNSFFDKYVTSEKTSGVGLGTYSAKLIAITQGGEIHLDTSVESETSIIIQFPY